MKSAISTLETVRCRQYVVAPNPHIYSKVYRDVDVRNVRDFTRSTGTLQKTGACQTAQNGMMLNIFWQKLLRIQFQLGAIFMKKWPQSQSETPKGTQ